MNGVYDGSEGDLLWMEKIQYFIVSELFNDAS